MICFANSSNFIQPLLSLQNMNNGNDWKKRLGMVYSTNPDFQFETENVVEQETLPKQQQKLRISIEKKNRGGKVATIVKGFIGSENDLKELGVGGSAKEGELIIQGEFKQKIIDILIKEGYTQTK